MARKRDDAVIIDTLPSEDQVIAYLRRNSDFLFRHPELLLVLSPPSRWTSADGIVDMQVFIIDRLRDELEQVKGAAEHIIHTSRSNLSTQSRTHQAVVALLEATDVATLARAVAEDLPQFLDVDIANLCFEPPQFIQGELPLGIRWLADNDVNRLLGGEDRDCALNDEMPGDPLLFGDGASLIQSSAIVRLMTDDVCPFGVIALGSRHGRTFHTGQGTELLSFLAHVIGACLSRFLKA
jgi:hypothetical protein